MEHSLGRLRRRRRASLWVFPYKANLLWVYTDVNQTALRISIASNSLRVVRIIGHSAEKQIEILKQFAQRIFELNKRRCELETSSRIHWSPNAKQVAHMRRGLRKQQKKTTPRLACVLFTTKPSFSRQPIGLFPYFPGLEAEVAHTGFSGLVRFKV
jgi:hypothetical protein